MSKVRESSGIGISRRTAMGAAVAAGALVALGPSPLWAQQMQTHLPPGAAPKPKGPLIFRDYDKEELDYC